MSRLILLVLLATLVSSALAVTDAHAFRRSRFAEDGDCSRCHTLSISEAALVVKSVNPSIEVLEVTDGPIEGLWEVTIMARGKKGIAYVDYSKEHIITGAVLKVSTRENLTNLKLYDLSKIDLALIPLDEALVMGNLDARYRVIVFDDPD